MDIMIDLETMGNGPNAAIVAIGAVSFDTEIHGEFYAAVDLESSMVHGGIVDASTILWWLKQSDAARKSTFETHTIHICQALVDFSNWIAGCGPTYDRKVWGNGASFDNVILRSAYQRAGLNPPWDWCNDRCYRTVANGRKKQMVGTAHNALDDARSQALHLMEIRNNG